MASSVTQPYAVGRVRTRSEAQRQLVYELVSGVSGAALAVFMWGHMFFVSSILVGTRGFDWLAEGLEDFRLAQPTVFVISALFLVHAAMASRKIPAQLRERRRMRELSRELRAREGSRRARRSPCARISSHRSGSGRCARAW